MTDTPALKPKWQLILGMLPSLNQSLIILVTAAASITGTIVTQSLMAKPVEQVKPVTVERVIERQVPVDLGPLTMKVEEALAELRAAKSAAGINRRKKTEPLK